MEFEDKETGENYLWNNKEGACYYGPGTSDFPMTRGLILHGGIRLTAVCPEHGLYYDSDWDLNFEVSPSGDEASLIFSIQDTAENRELLNDPFSVNGFGTEPMSNYPLTDANFIFKVTLRKGEKFLRTTCTVENTTNEPIQAEAWLPQTWPITEHSQIISHQKKRRLAGFGGSYLSPSWVYEDMIKDKFVVSDMGSWHDLPQYDGS